jgi:hypothetical protein
MIRVVQQMMGKGVLRFIRRRRQEPPCEHPHHPAVHADVPPQQVRGEGDIEPAAPRARTWRTIGEVSVIMSA